MKNRTRLLPLKILVLPLLLLVIYLVIRLAGCAITPVTIPLTGTSTGMPSTTASQAASSGATASNPSPATTLMPSPASSIPTISTPPATAVSTSVPTPAIPSTATTATTVTTTAAVDIQTLPNTRLGWSFIAGTPLGQDKPATIPTAARKLAEQYAAIWQMADSGRKVVYLTIDEGYEYQNHTASILDTASAKSVPLAFFISGSYLDHNPELVKRMARDGHRVANHTVTHPDLTALAASGGEKAVLGEIQNLEKSFQLLTGEPMAPLVRPPGGSYSERVLAILGQAGYRAVFWSFAYQDWLTDNQPDPAAAKKKILDQLHNGSVILLHAVSDTNVAILPELIDAIRARGYEFAPLGAD